MRFRTCAWSGVEGSTSARKGRRISRKTRGRIHFTGLLLLVAAGLLFAVPALSNTGPPTISSDQADYAPGSTVTLSGSSWQPGEDVHISVNDNVGQTWSYSGDVTADSAGEFTRSFQLPQSFVASYFATASGPSSGTATTTFTDSAYNLDQCTNGGVGDTPEPCGGSNIQPNGAVDGFENWVNGNANGQKAHWKEGEFISYRARLSGISAGSHTLIVHYDTVSNSKNALDYLGSFDATETTSATASTFNANKNDPCKDIVQAGEMSSGDCNPSSPTDTAAIPGTSALVGPLVITNCDGAQGAGPSVPSSPGNIAIFGPSGTDLGTVTYGNQNVDQGNGQCSTFVNISFDSPAIDASHAIVIAWGAHIASEADWGAGNSASTISGASYHMAIDSLDGTGGSQDHQLATSAIVFTPTIATTIEDSDRNPVAGTPPTVSAGTTVHDTATLSGASSNAGGKVTYNRFTNDECSGAPDDSEDVTVTNGVVPDSSDFTPTAAGSYSYQAVYQGSSGPPQNLPATSDCEPLTVTALNASASTDIHSGTADPAGGPTVVTSAQIGTSVHDSATVTGTAAGGTPTGSVTFSVWLGRTTCPDPTQVAPSDTATVTLVNGVADPALAKTVPVGGLAYKAHYNGSTTYNESDSACEPLTATRINSGASTDIHSGTADPAGGPTVVTSAQIGTSVHDSATVTGTAAGGTPTGSVTFSVWLGRTTCPDPTQVAPSDTATVTLVNGVADPALAKTVPVGGLAYKAHYNGSTTYNESDSACEPLTATRINSSTATEIHDSTENVVPNGGTVAAGSSVHDLATVTGTAAGGTPTGAVTFTFYRGGNCTTGTAESAGTVGLVNGVAHPSSSKVPLTAGSYAFKAHYNGSTTYNESDSACEPFVVVPKSVVTNTSLCTFDFDTGLSGQQFRLIFTPDTASGWKLNASNPGQWYYNAFFNGLTPNQTYTIQLTLPYPFVTQGAVPIHAYDGVTISTVNGQTCLVPQTEIGHSSHLVTLADYGANPTFATKVTRDVTFTADSTGFAYVNIHVDYGLKGTTGYAKGGASGNDAVDSTNQSIVKIPDKQSYTFTESDGTTSSATVQSENVFKKDPGIGGLVLRSTGDPVSNVQVTVAGDGKTATVYTDQDGWYMWQYKYTGKATTFNITLPAYKLSQSVAVKSNAFVVASFTVP
jgi:hypothetical protein